MPVLQEGICRIGWLAQPRLASARAVKGGSTLVTNAAILGLPSVSVDYVLCGSGLREGKHGYAEGRVLPEDNHREFEYRRNTGGGDDRSTLAGTNVAGWIRFKTVDSCQNLTA